MNKITVLGTAGDMRVLGKGLRHSGGIVLHSGPSQVHLDPGPGALDRLHACGVDPRATNLVLVTSGNLSACAGLGEVLSAMSLHGIDRKGTLIAHPAGKERITALERSYVEKVHNAEEGREWNASDVFVKAVALKGAEAVGFLIRLPGYSVLYIPPSEYKTSLAAACKDANVLIVSCANPPREHEKGQMNLDETMTLIHDAKPDVAIITNFSTQFIGKSHDHIDMARTVQKATGVQTIFAKDGLVFDPHNYSAQLKQKSLGTFLK